jgi:hypothetical protein
MISLVSWESGSWGLSYRFWWYIMGAGGFWPDVGRFIWKKHRQTRAEVGVE